MSLERAFILGSGQDDISFDCVVKESHTSEIEVTDNPVETGVVVSDHAYKRPDRLEIEGEVSDVWLHGFDPQTGLAIPDRFYSSKASRSASAWDILTGLQASMNPISVQTGLKLYANMMILSLSCDQDKLTAGTLSFRATLREVIRKTTQTVTYPPRQTGKPHRQASKKVDAGEKKTDPVTDQAKAKTLAKQLWDGFSSDPSKALGVLGF
jgi:hypothetical protein